MRQPEDLQGHVAKDSELRPRGSILTTGISILYDSSKLNFWFYFIAIILLASAAFSLRLSYTGTVEILTPIRADAAQYFHYGYNLKRHGVFSKEIAEEPAPDSYRSPGYPVLIAMSMYLSNTNEFDFHFLPVVIFLQCILGTITVILTWMVGVRLMPAWAAFATATLVAISPHLISLTSYLLTETLFAFLLVLALYLFIEAIHRRSILWFIAAGDGFGMASLTNETASLLPWLLATGVFLMQRANQTRIGTGILVIFLIAASALPAAWAYRNHVSLTEDSVTGSTRAITTLSHGAYPGFMHKDPRYIYQPYNDDPEQPEFSSSIGSFWTILRRRVAEDPLRYLKWYTVGKPYYLWSWDTLTGGHDVYIYAVTTSQFLDPGAMQNAHKIMQRLHPVIVLLALAAPFLLLMKGPQQKLGNGSLITIPVLVCLYYTLVGIVFAPWPRYSIPLRPELYLCALWSLSALLDRVRFGSVKNRVGHLP